MWAQQLILDMTEGVPLAVRSTKKHLWGIEDAGCDAMLQEKNPELPTVFGRDNTPNAAHHLGVSSVQDGGKDLRNAYA